MKKIVIANLKMSQTVEETKAYFTKLLCKFENENLQLIICPPFTSLSVAKFFTEGTDVKIGAQNVTDDDSVRQTGEISARMLRSVGVDYVIVGHPERRQKFKEGNVLVNRKIKSALKEGLKCIVCVGESTAEKLGMKTGEVLRKQVEECLKGLYENELESLVIAYEPLWAVGNNKTATIKEIEAGCKIIRKVINDNYSEKASRDIIVVYGGGLSPINAQKLFGAKEMDGVVFGDTALDVESFVSVVNKIK